MKLLPILSLALAACASAPRYDSQPVPVELTGVMQTLALGAPPARSLGVTLVVAEIPDDQHALGLTYDEGDEQWLIVVEARMCPTMQAWVLVHEWAHVLQGDSGTCWETDHGPLFGVLWAEAWRAYVGEGDEEGD